MSEQLTIRELAPYLPYGLEMVHEKSGRIIKIAGISIHPDGSIQICDAESHIWRSLDYWHCKPFVRPLSQLTETIEHNGESFVPAVKIGLHKILPHAAREQKIDDIIKRTLLMEYFIVEQLLALHFDVFGLIPRNLALPIKK